MLLTHIKAFLKRYRYIHDFCEDKKWVLYHHMGIHVSEEKERIVKEIEKFFTYTLLEAMRNKSGG